MDESRRTFIKGAAYSLALPSIVRAAEAPKVT